MKSLRIGLDIDGCIVEIVHLMERVLARDYGIKIVPYEETHEYDLSVVWGCSREEMKRRIGLIYGSHDFASLESEKDVQQALRTLFPPHQGFPLTARPDYLEPITKALFNRIGISFQHSYHLGHYDCSLGHKVTKVDIAKALPLDGQPLDFVVEDAIHEAEALNSAGIPVVLFSRPWNVGRPLPPMTTRVERWSEIVDYADSCPTRKLY